MFDYIFEPHAPTWFRLLALPVIWFGMMFITLANAISGECRPEELFEDWRNMHHKE